MTNDATPSEAGSHEGLGQALEEAAYDCMSALSGVNTHDVNLRDHPDAWAVVEAFAAKVQAAERERCAVVGGAAADAGKDGAGVAAAIRGA